MGDSLPSVIVEEHKGPSAPRGGGSSDSSGFGSGKGEKGKALPRAGHGGQQGGVHLSAPEVPCEAAVPREAPAAAVPGQRRPQGELRSQEAADGGPALLRAAPGGAG